MTYNQTIIGGNLTRDPELRNTPKGTPVAQFGVAVNRQWKDESGQLKEEVSFFDVEAWGRTAEAIAKWFKKGRPILVTGRLKVAQWDDKKTGEKKSKIKVVCESFQFCGGDKSEAQQAAPRQPTASTPAPELAGEGSDSEVPF